jgi:hypothetical protein
MLGQATPSSTQSWISDETIWEGSVRRSDDMVTHPDSVPRIFWVSFSNAERSDNVDCPDAVLFWEECHYSGKAVTEDRPDATRQSLNLNRIRFSVSL